MNKSEHEELLKIEEEIRAKNYDNNTFGVSDGVISFDDYTNKKTNYKILWILREPYEFDKVDKNRNKTKDKKIGGWSLANALNKRESWKQTVKSKGGMQTYRKLIQTTYAILNIDGINGFKKNSYKANFDYLKKIACINIKKMPGKSKSNDKVISKHFTLNEEILNQQIELCSPDITIYGGTFKYFKKSLLKKEPSIIELLNHNDSRYTKGAYYVIDGKLHIHTYHPSCFMKDENYCNNILNAVKEWENQKL